VVGEMAEGFHHLEHHSSYACTLNGAVRKVAEGFISLGGMFADDGTTSRPTQVRATRSPSHLYSNPALDSYKLASGKLVVLVLCGMIYRQLPDID